MKTIKIFFLVLVIFLLTSCRPSDEEIHGFVVGTIEAYTPHPTQTPFPTLPPFLTNTPFPTYTPYLTATPEPTIVVTRIVIRTPTPKGVDDACRPMQVMDYSNNTIAFSMLQAYVSTLPNVRRVSYTINERLYSNSLSHIVHVTYVADNDGNVYSKRYIVYLDEFGWSDGVFSIDGQCWVDGPHR